MEEYSKAIIIIGIKGMDGSILADLLLEKGYTNIHGIVRRSAVFNSHNIDHIMDRLTLHYGDVTDAMNIHNIFRKITPSYVFNFSAQSHVAVSDEVQNYTFQVNTVGVLNILQSVRSLGLDKTCRIYQASTSEEFGNYTDGTFKLNEDSPKIPVSIYGISKLAANNICKMYREAHGMFVVCSTLFNHEHERRGKTFSTQKIAYYVASVSCTSVVGKKVPPLQLGNLYAKRDWGYARDYVIMIYKMIQQETPEDFVISTGECHTIKEFCELAFERIGINIEWKGEGTLEKGYDQNGNVMIEVNEKYFRPIDIQCLLGDSSKAKEKLGWESTTSFKELVNIMVDSAIAATEPLGTL